MVSSSQMLHVLQQQQIALPAASPPTLSIPTKLKLASFFTAFPAIVSSVETVVCPQFGANVEAISVYASLKIEVTVEASAVGVARASSGAVTTGHPSPVPETVGHASKHQ